MNESTRNFSRHVSIDFYYGASPLFEKADY
jgi:hypothetical protein